MTGPMHTYFIGLTAVGLDVLWGSMIRNGTAQAIGASKSQGVMPHGSLLRRTFTGIGPLDRFLLSPVVFYDALTHDGNPVYRSLLLSVFSTMQTTSFSMMVLGWHNGARSKWAILEHLFWGVFNQSHGAALVYPLYFFTHLSRFDNESDEGAIGDIDPADAESLVYSSLLAAALPAWLIYPSYFSCSRDTRQFLIASYRATPAVLTLAQPLIASAIRRLRRTPLSKSRSRSLVRLSLVISGVCAALGHASALVSSAVSEGVTLESVFWPWATDVDRTASSVIAQGCHLFLQNDVLVIAAAVVPYASAILLSNRGDRAKIKDNSFLGRMESKMRNLGGRYVTLGFMTMVFSPGAVLSWALATKA
ncbi:hypothetical protein GGR54DRAFT_349721 [Hypoxylon sp. NC1633]|nr:hypothetical protein GGR54DRAFT_349721 [Hypoxylon sp. NC1633]